MKNWLLLKDWRSGLDRQALMWVGVWLFATAALVAANDRAAAANAGVGSASGTAREGGSERAPMSPAVAQYLSDIDHIVAEHKAKVEALKAKRKAEHAAAKKSEPQEQLTEAQAKAKLKARHERHKRELKEYLSLNAQLRSELDRVAKKNGRALQESPSEDKN